MHALRRFLLPLLAVTVIAPVAGHAEPDGNKAHGSIAPNLVPNLGAQAAHQAPAAPAPSPSKPAAPAPKQPAPIAPVPATARPPVTLPTGAPSFELIDRGDTVEVIAHNVKASRTAVLPLRSRLQIPIAGAPIAKRITPGDRTVKLVELDSEDATRVLSVKLGFEYADTKILSRYAQAIQIGDDLHVLVPRKVPAEGVAPKLPEPTLSVAAAAAMAKADHTAMLGPAPNPNAPPPPPPVAKPPVEPKAPQAKPPEPRPAAAVTAAAPIEAKPEPAKPEPVKPEAAKLEPAKLEPAKVEPVEKILGPATDPHARPAAKPAPESQVDADSDKPDKPEASDKPAAHDTHPRTDKFGRALAPPSDDLWSKLAMYAALGLGATGVGVWMLKRRRLNIPLNAEIDILAQRSLGGKARVIWLGAGDHELLIAVTPQAVNLLGQWPRGAAAAAMPADDTFAGRMAHSLGPLGSYAAASGNPARRTGSMPRQPTAPVDGAALPFGSAAGRGSPPVDDHEDDGVVIETVPDVRSSALRTARAAATRHAASLAEADRAPAPTPRAVTTESADEDPDYADYDAQATAAPPIPARREAKPSRPAIVLPPVPAAIAAEARIRRDSQIVRAPTQGSAASEADADKPMSPAVNGILRLRSLTSQVPVTQPPRDDDETNEVSAVSAADAASAVSDSDSDDADAPKTAEGVSAEDREAEQAWIKELMAGGGSP